MPFTIDEIADLQKIKQQLGHTNQFVECIRLDGTNMQNTLRKLFKEIKFEICTVQEVIK
jgi:hypothetical protein